MDLSAEAASVQARLVVVTGANGFIGRALCARFTAEHRPHRRVVRAVSEHEPPPSTIALGDLAATSEADLAATLDGAFAVVHLAGRAHVMRDTAPDAAALFHRANVIATERLARAAARVGVQRMILASTVKVHGDRSEAGRPLRAGDALSPRDDYASSKAGAERALLGVCSTSALTPFILRLPLTYGPGVRGNFLSLMDAVARRVPLPFAAIHNRRHLLYVGNLVHAITRLLDRPQPPAGAWMLADHDALSTPELARRIGASLDVRARIFWCPVLPMRLAAMFAGHASAIARLTQSLEVDASPLAQEIGALPSSVDEGLAATAKWWRARHSI